jgi:hypothetical protein
MTEMGRVNWLSWVFIATGLGAILTVALPYLSAITIELVAILA